MATDHLPAVTREPSRTGERFLRALPIDPARAWIFWDLGVTGAARLRLAFDSGAREEHRVHADIGDFFVYRDAPFRRLDAEISAEDGSIRFTASLTLPPSHHGDEPLRWGRIAPDGSARSTVPAEGPERVPQAPATGRRAAVGSSELGPGRFQGASERFIGASERHHSGHGRS